MGRSKKKSTNSLQEEPIRKVARRYQPTSDDDDDDDEVEAVDQTDAQRFLRADALSTRQHREGLAGPDDARQSLRAPVARQQAHADFGQPEFVVTFRSNAHIAGHRDLEPAA